MSAAHPSTPAASNDSNKPIKAAAPLAVVAIGRNEGERLRRCLQSVVDVADLLVYVDSGSTDGSVEFARSLGAEVVVLDPTLPFTAARARNEGLRRAMERLPNLDRVQFVDGDCEIVQGWLQAATEFLRQNPTAAAVFGRRRERHPEKSVYNRLCDIEWDVQPGEVKYCGGDVMFRREAIAPAGGYREDLIAGEEPELCVRLRAKGWTIHCIPGEMTRHDAAMTRFSQWWRRTVRCGYAYAEGARLHGRPPERHWVRSLKSSLAWGTFLPLVILLAGLLISPWLSLMALLYPLQILRLTLRGPGDLRTRFQRAFYLILGKFPESQGALRHGWHVLTKRRSHLIEYK
jgi:glycosyltransferase involved in cell wall biosynthesis